MAATSIIMPPIVPDIEPSFVKINPCKVYFSFSEYNSKNDIKNIQISVVNQKTNMSVLKSSDYPTGIKIVSGWSTDGDPNPEIFENEIQNDYKYYVLIYPDDLINGFETNEIYKVQLRFTKIGAQDPDGPNGQATAKWINDNLDYFSEWSRVCLIKGIEKPYIQLKTRNQVLSQIETTTLSASPTEFIGKLYYEQNTNIEKETLKSYNITIYQQQYINENQTIDFSKLVKYNYVIVINPLRWVLHDTAQSYIINNNKINSITITASNSGTCIVAFLKSYSPVHNDPPDFADNTTRISISSGQTKTFSVPKDAKYIYISAQSTTGINLTPSSTIINLPVAKKNILIKSNEIYTNQFNPNEFYYELLYDLNKQINYTLGFNYTTNNLYNETKFFNFIIAKQASNKLNATITATPEETNGSIKLDINFGMLSTTQNLIIKRSSAKTNFLQWENLKTISHNRDLEHLWYDTSIESGIWYKYRIQQTEENERISEISQPVMCLFEDAFLTQGNKQLKIQFNPSVSDFKYNVTESQQVTLGAQYPYIKRNGNNYYRTFSLSGLVSALMDEIRWYNPGHLNGQFYDKNSIQPFTTQNELFGDAATALYNEYNQTNNISYYQDYVYERAFRQKVMQFLYGNNIKLFRSLTEGNILVKLTNIAFQPIDTLGRRLYSFSATAIEIDKTILENLNKYNLINKLYYTYAKKTLQDTFESEESLIDKFYLTWPEESKEATDIMQLNISHNISQDIVVYAKPINNNNLLRYIAPKGGTLQIFYSDADPIAESYFYGIHFNDNELKPQEGHYENPQDVKNPINYGVYSIVEHYFIRIDRYIQYFREADLLSTYHDEVLQNNADNKDYDLLVESMEPVYFNMIYYEGQWYPLLDNNDIIIKNFPATIVFTYRTKKED